MSKQSNSLSASIITANSNWLLILNLVDGKGFLATRVFLLSIFPRSFVFLCRKEDEKKAKEKCTTRNRNYNIKKEEHPSTRLCVSF